MAAILAFTPTATGVDPQEIEYTQKHNAILEKLPEYPVDGPDSAIEDWQEKYRAIQQEMFPEGLVTQPVVTQEMIDAEHAAIVAEQERVREKRLAQERAAAIRAAARSEDIVMSQFVAPRMSEAEARRQGSMTVAPSPEEIRQIEEFLERNENERRLAQIESGATQEAREGNTVVVDNSSVASAPTNNIVNNNTTNNFTNDCSRSLDNPSLPRK